MNITEIITNKSCDCVSIVNYHNKIMIVSSYMSIFSFAVVVYIAVTYRFHRELFDRTIEDAIFLLILSSAWLFESAIYKIMG